MAVQAAARTFDRVVMKARTVAAIVPITIELLQDVVNLPAMLEDALAKALGLKLDQANLAGPPSSTCLSTAPARSDPTKRKVGACRETASSLRRWPSPNGF